MFLNLCLSLGVFGDPTVCREDLDRFPAKELATTQADFAWQHRKWVEGQAQFHPEDAARYEAWRVEACRRYHLWHLLKSAHEAREYGWEDLTETLTELRELLGFEHYYRGEMLPCVPLEYYTIH